jgi:hypothetical protein
MERLFHIRKLAMQVRRIDGHDRQCINRAADEPAVAE